MIESPLSERAFLIRFWFQVYSSGSAYVRPRSVPERGNGEKHFDGARRDRTAGPGRVWRRLRRRERRDERPRRVEAELRGTGRRDLRKGQQERGNDRIVWIPLDRLVGVQQRRLPKAIQR